MTNQIFTPGDIVFHKANNLRMVVISCYEAHLTLQFVNTLGKFIQDDFPITVINRYYDDSLIILTQLESKTVS